MRTLLVWMLAFLPLLPAQDSTPVKTAEPQYDNYSGDLTDNFEVVNASVNMTVMANGKPLTLNNSSVPLPMAVIMALKDYEFRPQPTGPHGRGEAEVGVYQVTLNVPVRQRRDAVRRSESAIRVNPGIAKGLLVTQVRPEYPEFARHNRIQAVVTFLEVAINTQGEAESLKTNYGPFLLIEAAYNAVRQWRWRPYLLNNAPVEVVADIPISFNLN